jgi:3-oxoacyl-[acyl-carrier-protein] synthase-3
MTVGIEAVGRYIPVARLVNADKKAQFAVDDAFLTNKIGVREVAVKAPGETLVDMCAQAFDDLRSRATFALADIDTVALVTSSPMQVLPHTSAVLHGRLGLSDTCAVFDVGLACSGYVYGLALLQAFMSAHGRTRGLLFTGEPFSDFIDRGDKNTALLFGDAATVTLLGPRPRLTSGVFRFGTRGRAWEAVTCSHGKTMVMDGHAIFTFAGRVVAAELRQTLDANGLAIDGVAKFLLHQGSKYILDTIRGQLGVEAAKVPCGMTGYGNTAASSIPLLLADEFAEGLVSPYCIAGFGSGLSWASTVLTTTEVNR